jgi:GntR family transcriptional regulator
VQGAQRSRKSGPSVDPRQPIPLYHQIFLILRDQIQGGRYAADDFLPTEHALMAEFSVSRVTAKRALDELAAAGLAIRSRGRGTQVQFDHPATTIRAPLEGVLENLLAMGLKTEVELIEFDYVPANAEVAAALESAIGQTVQRAVRVRRLKREPFSFLTTYVPEAIGRSYTAADLASRPLLSLLERAGAEVSRAEQTISAALADTEVARRLDVAVGAALIKIARIVYDPAGRPIEFITGLYRPDRYQYKMSLSRVERGAKTLWSAGDDPHSTIVTLKKA